MALISGIGLMIFPLAEVVGGQLYKYGGFYWVYGMSYGSVILAILYLTFCVPETLPSNEDHQLIDNNEEYMEPSAVAKIKKVFIKGNKALIDQYHCLIKPREGSKRKIIAILVGISCLSSFEYSGNGYLFAQKVFGWDLVTYTNWAALFMLSFVFRAFITTPVMVHFLKIHDCMLAITGGLASAAAGYTIVSTVLWIQSPFWNPW